MQNKSIRPDLVCPFLHPLPPPVTDVLRKLPLHGVGCRVARDTWAPESGRYWDIAHVMTRKVRIKHVVRGQDYGVAAVLQVFTSDDRIDCGHL